MVLVPIFLPWQRFRLVSQSYFCNRGLPRLNCGAHMWGCLLTTQHVKVLGHSPVPEFCVRREMGIIPKLLSPPASFTDFSFSIGKWRSSFPGIPTNFSSIREKWMKWGWGMGGTRLQPRSFVCGTSSGNESHAFWLSWRQHLGWLLKPVSSSLEVFLVLQYQSHYITLHC